MFCTPMILELHLQHFTCLIRILVSIDSLILHAVFRFDYHSGRDESLSSPIVLHVKFCAL